MLTAVEIEHFGTVPVRRRDCPLCGSDNAATPPSRYSQAPWLIKRCAACRFVYMAASLPPELQSETLAWECTSKLRDRRRAASHPIAHRLSRRTRFRLRLLPRRRVLRYLADLADGNVLDLGCGDGQAMQDLPPRFTPFGIEIAAAAAARADVAFAARGGQAINAPCVVGLRRFSDGFFRMASLRSYLEHEADPLAVLLDVHRVLAPDGFAVVKVPNYASLNRLVMGRRWCGFHHPDHLNYFTPASLRAMAAKAGFRARFGLTGRLPTSDSMWAVLTKCRPDSRLR